jgi:hypothetical protein
MTSFCAKSPVKFERMNTRFASMPASDSVGGITFAIRDLFRVQTQTENSHEKFGVPSRTEGVQAGLQADEFQTGEWPEATEVKECEAYARAPARRCRQQNRTWNLGRRNGGSPAWIRTTIKRRYLECVTYRLYRLTFLMNLTDFRCFVQSLYTAESGLKYQP